LIVYSGLIFWLSSQPQVALARNVPDYLLHFAAYLAMGVLALRAFGRGLSLPSARRAAFLATAFSLAFAASDEYHQSFVPGRVASVRDLVADGLGILAAIAALAVCWRRRERREGEH